MKSMKIIKQDLEAYIYPSGNWYIIWHKNCLSHREDGPASIWADGHEYYWIRGEAYNNGGYWKEVHENY